MYQLGLLIFRDDKKPPIQVLSNYPPGGDAVREISGSHRNVENLLHERGIDISDETLRFWWDRFGPMFAADKWRLFLMLRSPAKLKPPRLIQSSWFDAQ